MSKRNDSKIALKNKAVEIPNKTNGKIVLSNGNSPERPMFNFSFISKKFDTDTFEDKETYRKLVTKIIEMSQMSLVELLSRPRNSGLEVLHEKDFKTQFKLRDEFINSHRSDLVGEDYWIFRISHQARVLAKRTDTLFYIVAIDEKHKIYKG
ncbi:hypothetical protein [Weissella paramesenteroides]|uniref:hypothetical protein n=2 Tax=Weissella TaxID=46255 RepID=UPI0011675A06|nr:hypothetical protein [Weissella paramesenteroides]KAA8446994.1 hypothetical protein FKV72_04150 [Weissella paramesenteroides]KAA8449918.1 hypothetical protein FKV71_09400 [Weissella paramesenteroides]MCT0485666.1 hypothetical protein [Weissella paramesenteroides]MDF8373995.1 hypothetical protein [Weissella paramesenteroides]NEZ88557.1 hypothetical protein [Weissella paramesenteroides]